jgi:hypothetical protein
MIACAEFLTGTHLGLLELPELPASSNTTFLPLPRGFPAAQISFFFIGLK